MNSDQLKGYSAAISHLAFHMDQSAKSFLNEGNVDLSSVGSFMDSFTQEQLEQEMKMFKISEVIAETYGVDYNTVMADVMYESMLRDNNV